MFTEDTSHVSETIRFPDMSVTPRERQTEAVDQLTTTPCGLLHASTGLGKTVMIADLIRRSERRTLVVCSSIGLMEQMRDDLQEIFGVRYQTLSGSKKSQKGSDGSVVIANIDSVVKQDRDWLD